MGDNLDTSSTGMEFIKSHVPAHLPSYISAAATVILGAVIAFGNFQKNTGAADTERKDLERRISALEQDAATRREVDEIRKTVDRVENKLDAWKDQEMKLHHGVAHN